MSAYPDELLTGTPAPLSQNDFNRLPSSAQDLILANIAKRDGIPVEKVALKKLPFGGKRAPLFKKGGGRVSTKSVAEKRAAAMAALPSKKK